MVVRDLNIIGVTVHETKTDAPLVVDANRVLSLPFPLKAMEIVPGRCSEVIQP
jgi:hypothetical protein